MPAVPRERVETALLVELNRDVLTDLRTVAASVGLSSKRRLYKGFQDLRSAIVAKNTAIRQRRVDAIENPLWAAFDEQPHTNRGGGRATPGVRGSKAGCLALSASIGLAELSPARSCPPLNRETSVATND